MLRIIRDALIGLVAAPFATAYPNVPLVVDNAPFDWNSPPPLFVTLEIRFYAGNQIGMAAEPKTRRRGYVYVSVYVREGRGSREALGLLSWFDTLMGYATLVPVGARIQLQEAEPVGSQARKGWYIEGMKIAFHVDPAP